MFGVKGTCPSALRDIALMNIRVQSDENLTGKLRVSKNEVFRGNQIHSLE